MKKLLIYFMTIMAVSFTACQKKMKHAMYEGKDLSKQVQVVRDKESKAATLYVDVQGPWKIYSGNTVEDIDFSKPLLEGKDNGVFPLEVSNSTRSYFQFVSSEGKAILAEEHLPMTGGYNFRDLGGIRSKDGKYVRWGKIIRSDDLSNLTSDDLKYLASIPVRTIIDFRAQSEIDMAPDKLASSVVEYLNLNIEPGNIMGSDIEFDMETVDFNELMITMNRLLVTDSSAISQYKEFFCVLQQEESIPLLYHCSAGKDRTGMASALILYALGVDDETVMDNYLKSAVYLTGKYDKLVQQYPMIEPLMTVKAEFLQAGIDQMRADHGSVENYLTKVLEVDINKMKEMFLY